MCLTVYAMVGFEQEKFLEQFSDEAYDYSVQDRKKSLAYKHLCNLSFFLSLHINFYFLLSLQLL
jgi:hypothetical protein